MAPLRPQDRTPLCRFTFSDSRKCLTPRAPNHPHFCYYHARKESKSTNATNLAQDLAYYFSGEYLSANDLSAALARILPAALRSTIAQNTTQPSPPPAPQLPVPPTHASTGRPGDSQ